MKISTLETYGLSVCFVSAIALAIALCTLLYTLVQIFRPRFVIDRWDYQRHLSNEAFWEQKIRPTGEVSAEKPVRPDEETLTRQRYAVYQQLAGITIPRFETSEQAGPALVAGTH